MEGMIKFSQFSLFSGQKFEEVCHLINLVMQIFEKDKKVKKVMVNFGYQLNELLLEAPTVGGVEQPPPPVSPIGKSRITEVLLLHLNVVPSR